jgi:hypothetical protein
MSTLVQKHTLVVVLRCIPLTLDNCSMLLSWVVHYSQCYAPLIIPGAYWY